MPIDNSLSRLRNRWQEALDEERLVGEERRGVFVRTDRQRFNPALNNLIWSCGRAPAGAQSKRRYYSGEKDPQHLRDSIGARAEEVHSAPAVIEDPPQLTVHPRPQRPEPALVEAFRGAQTGHVVDAMDGRGALGGAIKPVPGTPDEVAAVVGVALTCWAGPDDNLAIIGAIAEARPGDIVVAATDAFQVSAVAGDMVAGMLRNQGVVALVMDGMARDSAGIHAVGLPFFCAGITPNSCARNGPGTVGAPVTLAGVSVSSGDIVVADRDGVVIVPSAQAAAVAARLEEIRTLERAFEAQIEAGLGVPGFYQDLVDSGAVRRLD